MTTPLESLETAILRDGPSRVLVSSKGEAVSSLWARERGILPDVIFIRRDGWSLGTLAHLERAAFDIWSDEWVAYWRRGEATSRPIAEWDGRRK